MRRRIAVFTSSRADLGPLGPVIAELDAHPDIELVVIATGTHMDSRFGGRLEDITLSGDSVLEPIDADIEGTEASQLGEVYARVASGTSRVLARRAVDFLVLLGDRWELLAAAGAALIHGVAIAHLHGGETTEGAIDERIRHGITKLADIHLCATEDSARRIRQLGEEPWRIKVTGAPGLDRVGDIVAFDDSEVASLAGGPVGRPLGVVIYHPPTVDRSRVAQEARAVFEASAAALGTAVVLYPGADPGAEIVMAELQTVVDAHENVVGIRNLGPGFLRLLAAADVLIGNSSSGIIEAASFSLPVVDVGDRQRGRIRPDNVIHAESTEQVAPAVQRALAPGFRTSLAGLTNPYGDGKASPRIAEALVTTHLERLARKPLLAIGPSDVNLAEMTVSPRASIREAMIAINRTATQIALVVDDDQRLLGTVSDGDLRRALLAGATLDGLVAPHTTRVPITTSPGSSLTSVLSAMQREGVTQVPVLDGEGRLVGVHLMRAVVGELLDTPGILASPDVDPGDAGAPGGAG